MLSSVTPDVLVPLLTGLSIPSPDQGVWHLGPVPIRGYALSIILGIVAAIAALAAGAALVNDVSGGLADPRILDVVADAGAPYVAMHWRAHSDHMRDFAVYDGPGGVVEAVRAELAARVDAMLAAGMVKRAVPCVVTTDMKPVNMLS